MDIENNIVNIIRSPDLYNLNIYSIVKNKRQKEKYIKIAQELMFKLEILIGLLTNAALGSKGSQNDSLYFTDHPLLHLKQKKIKKISIK